MTEQVAQQIARMSAAVDWSTCPAGMRDGLQRYVEHGIEPGGYLTAVLRGDLFDAMGRADLQSRRDMFDLCSFIFNFLPNAIWGDRNSVSEWVAYWAEVRKQRDRAVPQGGMG